MWINLELNSDKVSTIAKAGYPVLFTLLKQPLTKLTFWSEDIECEGDIDVNFFGWHPKVVLDSWTMDREIFDKIYK